MEAMNCSQGLLGDHFRAEQFHHRDQRGRKMMKTKTYLAAAMIATCLPWSGQALAHEPTLESGHRACVAMCCGELAAKDAYTPGQPSLAEAMVAARMLFCGLDADCTQPQLDQLKTAGALWNDGIIDQTLCSEKTCDRDFQ
jgi:hypothetical protein